MNEFSLKQGKFEKEKEIRALFLWLYLCTIMAEIEKEMYKKISQIFTNHGMTLIFAVHGSKPK